MANIERQDFSQELPTEIRQQYVPCLIEHRPKTGRPQHPVFRPESSSVGWQ
jgi:hypothetical protein